MKVKTFKSYDDYAVWSESFENASDCEEFPTYIEDKNNCKIAADMIVYCKKEITAVKRFAKQFEKFALVKEWAIDSIMECVNNGTFKDTYIDDVNMYSWGVEYIDDGMFYIYLSLRGVYATA